MNQYYKDRDDAAIQLLDTLPLERIRAEKWKIIAVSPGGLKIASKIAFRAGVGLNMLFFRSNLCPFEF